MKLNTAKALVEAAVKSGSEESLHDLVDWAMASPDPDESVVVLEIFDVLRSQEALLQLQMLAYSQSTPSLVSGAREKLEAIAQSRGVRSWELEDLIVPNCGLASENKYPFEIAGTSYQLRMNAQLEPLFVDAQGQVFRANEVELQPNMQRVIDDISDVLPTQILRLEMALGTEQRWRTQHWKDNVFGHPVLFHLVQRLVWGVFSEAGRLHQTFRVSEEGEFADMNDKPVQIDDGHVIGVLHPLNVEPEVLSGWSAMLADYEIPTLCPQLDRPIFTHDPEHPKAHSLSFGRDVFGDEGILLSLVSSGLLSRGWHLTSSYYGTIYSKVFRQADVVAQIQFQQTDSLVHSADLTFRRFLGHPRHNFQFRDVHPIVYSEAVLDIKHVAGGAFNSG